MSSGAYMKRVKGSARERAVFAGKFTNAIDAKGRCIVPAKFRHDLGSSCMLVKDFGDSLFLYPREYWERYATEHIESRPDEDPDAMDMKFLFYQNTCECEIDKQGRINMPKDFIEHAGITREMVNIGSMNRIQIWSKERFEEKTAEIAPRGRELFNNMHKYVPKP
jgi:MraZ protein